MWFVENKWKNRYAIFMQLNYILGLLYHNYHLKYCKLLIFHWLLISKGSELSHSFCIFFKNETCELQSNHYEFEA